MPEILEARTVPAFTGSVFAGGASGVLTGDGAADTLIIDQSGGLLRHNRFGLDADFASEFDFDTTQAGVQTIALPVLPGLTVNCGDGDDLVQIGTPDVPASLVAGRFLVHGEVGTDTVIWENTTDATDREVNVQGGIFNQVFIPFTGASVGFGTTNEAVSVLAGNGSDTIRVSEPGLTNVSVNAGGGDDMITFADAATLGGSLDGGAGVNTIDYSAYTTGVAVNLGLAANGLAGTLSADQVVPPTNSPATGTIVSTYNPGSKTFDITVIVTDLDPDDVSGFHVRRGAVGQDGPVIFDFMPGGVPIAPLVPDGTGFTFTANLTLPFLNEADFLGGITYVNIETAAHPDGAIRGQIFSQGNVNLAANGFATGTSFISNIQNVLGGSAADSLVGSFASNSLQGNGGGDTIIGGPGPAPAGDTLAGNAGTDVIVWSSGDGSDVIDGGSDGDIVQVNGSLSAADLFEINAGAGGRIDFDRVSPGPFSLDIGTVDVLTVVGNGGNDSFTVNDLAAVGGLSELNLFGFAGNDEFVFPALSGSLDVRAHGGPGSDTITGPDAGLTYDIEAPGAGSAFGLLDGFRFIEALNGGAGNDTFILRPDASLSGPIDGGGGANVLDYDTPVPIAVNLGSNASSLTATLGPDQETTPTSSAASGNATITYDNVAHTLDIALTVADLSPSDVSAFHLHSGQVGVDGAVLIDLLTLGTLVPDGTGFTFAASGVPLPAIQEAAFLGGLTYLNIHTGAFPSGEIRGQVFANTFVAAPATASFTGGISNITKANGGSGGDSIVGNLAANTLDGAGGNDTLIGSGHDDLLRGGEGNDFVVWNEGDGNDVIDGQVGTDTVLVNGAPDGADVFHIGANGTHVDFIRSIPALFILDIGTTEVLAVHGQGGNDTFEVRDLTGVLDLADIHLDGLGGADTFDITPAAAVTMHVNGFAPAAGVGDVLLVNRAGTTNPVLTSSSTAHGLVGQWTFDDRQPIHFQQIEAHAAILSISGQVFDDFDADGVQDPGEPGVAGVVVHVEDNNSFEATAFTDAGGNYSFSDLASGVYRVRVFLSGAVQTTADPADIVALTVTNQTGVDFGSFQRFDIAGRKFVDLNGDGDDESVVLLGEALTGGLGSFTADGLWHFTTSVGDNLRGHTSGGLAYYGIDAQNTFNNGSANSGNLTSGDMVLPAGAAYLRFRYRLDGEGGNPFDQALVEISTDGGASFTTVASNGNGDFPQSLGWSIAQIDLSAFAGQTIRLRFRFDTLDSVSNDFLGWQIDDIQVFGGGEPGLPGVTLFSDTGNDGVLDAGEPDTVSGAGGLYVLRNLGPGTHLMRELVLAGHVQTTLNPAGIVASSSINVDGVDFGNFEAITISGQKFDDLDGDGVHDAGEPGQDGVTIQLIRDANDNGLNDDALFATTTTSGSGAYGFANLGPGRYFVQELVPAGSIQTFGPAFYTVVASSGGDIPNQDFGNFTLISISGRVADDLNGDGVIVGDAGQGGVTIALVRDANSDGLNNDAVLATTVSGGSGAYSFANLGPGRYFVQELVPTDSVQTFGPAFYTIVASSGVSLSNQDFGNFELFDIRGKKFDDLDGDGAKDPGEPGISGITIQLDLGADGSIDATTTTNGNGQYSFADLGPGTYRVREATPAGALQTTVNPADMVGSSGGDVIGVHFGNFELITISGQVFDDLDADGVKDANEPGLPDIAVTLDRGADGVIDTATTTDANGNYTFADLGPGVYRVGVETNSGVVTTAANPPDIAATSGVDVGGVDFGLGRETVLAIAADRGALPRVQVFNTDGSLRFDFLAYPANFHGGVRVATGDVTGDGVPDIITAPGTGRVSQIKVFDGNPVSAGSLVPAEVARFRAFNPTLKNGFFVAVGDVNGDGTNDIVTSAGPGSPPEVRAFDGTSLFQPVKTLIGGAGFVAFDPAFAGGVTVASGDIDGDGRAEIVTGVASKSAPRVNVWELAPAGNQFNLLEGFQGLPADLSRGVFVSVGDFTGDGRRDIIVSAARGMHPRVQVFATSPGNDVIFAGLPIPAVALDVYPPTQLGGARIVAKPRVEALTPGLAAAADLFAGYGLGSTTRAIRKIAHNQPGDVTDAFFANGVEFEGGVFVG